MIGIAIGIVAGMVAGANGRSGGWWAAAGVVCFGVAWALNRPENVDIGQIRVQQMVGANIPMGAISGLCGAGCGVCLAEGLAEK